MMSSATHTLILQPYMSASVHDPPREQQRQDAVPVGVSVRHVKGQAAAHLHQDQTHLRKVHDALSKGTTHVLNDFAVPVQQQVA